MPRAKARTDEPEGWIVQPLKLSADTSRRLIEAADLRAADPRARVLIERTREILGQYPDVVRAYDHGPRPASQLLALGEIEKYAERLASAIDDADPNTRDALNMVSRVNLHAVRHDLREIDRAISIVRMQLDGRESRGAVPREGRAITLSLLADAYRDATTIDEPDDYHEQLVGFLRIACEAAQIDLPDTPEKILQILPDSVKVPKRVPS